VSLTETIAGWRPAPVETGEVLGHWPVAAFSSLLDLPGPAGGPGDPLPPLWHWFHFLDHPRRSELGEDGHPAAGAFLPPIPDRRRMFAGGRLQVHEPMLIGEEIIRRSAVSDVKVKNGRSGEMAFVTVNHDYFRGDTLLVNEQQDIVYRSQPSGGQRALPPHAGETAAEPYQWAFKTPTEPALLFRFSALTYNTHRIHYDQAYAMGVEGYPGLVVHGPLLALLLLEIPRRNLPERVVTGFEFRLARPVFCGDLVVAAGNPDGGWAVNLSAGVPGRSDAVTGVARLSEVERRGSGAARRGR